jgi:hypothetical protein
MLDEKFNTGCRKTLLTAPGYAQTQRPKAGDKKQAQHKINSADQS